MSQYQLFPVWWRCIKLTIVNRSWKSSLILEASSASFLSFSSIVLVVLPVLFPATLLLSSAGKDVESFSGEVVVSKEEGFPSFGDNAFFSSLGLVVSLIRALFSSRLPAGKRYYRKISCKKYKPFLAKKYTVYLYDHKWVLKAL